MIELMFPDGTVARGRTYRAAEDDLRAAQWTAFRSRRAFRREFRRRAVLWSRSKVTFPAVQTSKGFLNSLAKAGMCRIEKTNERGLV